ncbi:GNAT family N-acetyltransferase [Rhodococcus sp. GOMB7]|uniref:GNAT family N-acetyltransferase n=1 Tax=Rhodococcus sp. GOMB7 TaxID=2839033 RepID=UPI0004A8931B|nr:GNAT family N-acetyltransferase [Rhodococcus sp. GOMB7]KDQ01678.1 GNAT family acetyltransferase [Rhodococcus qingshengii]MBT9295646.1 GNAT family N-acetyltransferase [Rhodococcus sp. GOMB7]
MNREALVGDVLDAMDANLVSHACHLHEHLPTGSVSADVVVADSGLTDDTFNIIAGARFAVPAAEGPEEDRRLLDVLAWLRATGRPFSWWTGPRDKPSDLGARLSAVGCVRSEEERAMTADLNVVPRPTPVSELCVQRVTTRSQLADYAAVMAANWSPPSTAVIRFFEDTADDILDERSRSSFVVGYANSQPVAGAEVHFAADVAGLYGVVTLETARRRGFGSAVTLAALDIARERGARTAVLQASSDGAQLYRNVGFEDVGTYAEYSIGSG